MQIEIYTPTQAQPLPPVQWNYEEVKQWVADGLAAYKGRVYTEESIATAKKDRAALNKLAEAIDGKRKEMKALYLHPYEQFEAQAKELTAMVKEQSAAIDAQVKAFDEMRKQEKLEKIKAEIYTPIIGDLAELVPYDRLHNPKWLNVSVSMNTISEEIARVVERVESGLSSIDKLGLDPDMVERIKGVFLRNYDLAAALAEKERIEKKRAELARYEAAKQAAREAAQPAQTSDGASGRTEPERAPVRQETPSVPLPKGKLYTLVFQVRATADQISALKDFLKNNHIQYGRA